MRFNFARQSLIAASLLTLAANVLSAGLGYLREAFTASYFGTSALLDVFILAFTVPEFIASVIYLCLPAAIIPSINRASGDKADMFWSGLMSFTPVMAFIALAVYFLKSSILIWLTEGLSIEEIELGERILTIFVFYIFFRGLEYYFRGWLYERKHFIAPVLMGIIQNVVVIVTLVVMYKSSSVEALAYGWLFSSIILFVYNGISVFWLVRPGIRISLLHPWLKYFFSSIVLIGLIEGITMSYPIIDRFLASKYLESGYIPALRYAMVLIILPNRLFATALSMASFPFIADLFKSGAKEKLAKLYSDGIHLMLFAMGLIASYVAVFSREVLTVALKRGAFDLHSLELTSGPLVIYSAGIVFHAFYLFQMKFYYAASRYARLGAIKLVMFGIKLLLSVLLIFHFKHNGLAVATIVAWLVGFIIMGIDLSKLVNYGFNSEFFSSIMKNVAVLAGLTLFWIVAGKLWPYSELLTENLLKLIVLGGAGLIIYVLLARKFKFREYELLRSVLLSKLTFGKQKNN